MPPLQCSLVLWMVLVCVAHSDGTNKSRCSDPNAVTKDCWHGCGYKLLREAPGPYFPLLIKKFDCHTIFQAATLQHKPPERPPKQMPDELKKEYLQNGELVLANWHLEEVVSKSTTHWDVRQNFMKFYEFPGTCNQELLPYRADCCIFFQLLRKYRSEIIGKRGLVLGSRIPWAEIMLLGVGLKSLSDSTVNKIWDEAHPNPHGANEVLTIEYGEIQQDHPRIKTLLPQEAAAQFIQGRLQKVDFIVQYSSVEHSGLGRYGDPLLPCGDLDAMAQLYCFCKRDCTLFSGVPGNSASSYVVWNAHRLYGPQRLKHLYANWQVIDIYPKSDWVPRGSMCGGAIDGRCLPWNHLTFVMKKWTMRNRSA